MFVADDHHPAGCTSLAPEDFPAPGGIREREAGPDREAAPYSSPASLQGANGPITPFLRAGGEGADVLRPKSQHDLPGAPGTALSDSDHPLLSGPKQETVNDFWRMIWEQKCATIVMLTNLKERKEVSPASGPQRVLLNCCCLAGGTLTTSFSLLLLLITADKKTPQDSQHFYFEIRCLCSQDLIVLVGPSVQFLSRVRLFVTPWTAARQASLSITNSQSLLKLMSIESVMPSNRLILCCPLLLLPSIFPSVRVFSNESTLRIRWPKYWSFSFSISPSNEYSGLISFRMYWLDLLAVQWTLRSLLQHHSSKASILRCLAFFIVQLSYPRL